MTLRPCGFSTDRQEGASSSLPSRLTTKSNNVLNLPAAIFNYVIKTPPLWIPLSLLILATVIFRFTNADLILSRPFFIEPGVSMESRAHWPLKVAEPWRTLYTLGIYPAWIIGVGGMLVFLVSFCWSKLKPYRDPGLFFALMLALGPGLLINGILKPYWLRPRPHQTIPFGGTQEYLSVGDRGDRPESYSFPSGHASMAFYLMAPGFVLYRRRPGWAAFFFGLGIASGLIMGLTRIVAGSHFASDVVWSAGVVYFTGLGLSALFRFGNSKIDRAESVSN